MKITDAKHLTERMKCECAKIENNAEVLHRVHVDPGKSINHFIKDAGNLIEDAIS